MTLSKTAPRAGSLTARVKGRLPALMAALLAAALLLVFRASPVQAGPPAPVNTPLSQPDGSTIQARQWGDEWQHGYETLDGYTIVPDPSTQLWVYAQEVDGALVPAVVDGQPLIAGRDSPAGLLPGARPEPVQHANRLPLMAQPGPEYTSNQGSQPLLLLLVAFSDRGPSYSASHFQASFFGSTNSVQDYYRKASFNRLVLAPAAETHGTINDGVIGWITLNYPHPNTADLGPKIVNDALTAANNYINYARYDTNRDGYISNTELHLVIVTTGYEESVSGTYGPTPRMWAHRWSLDEEGFHPILDGVQLAQANRNGGYTMFGEIHHYGDVAHAATIGVMVHELGHDLSWPDLYDISNRSEGVGSWSIMGSGSWNTARPDLYRYGDTPALPDAFSRYYQGWITPVLAFNGQTVRLNPESEGSVALLFGANPNGVDWNFRARSGTGEYWLVEYRRQTGFDAGLPGCGVLIWHIDETVTYQNQANANRDRPLIELEQADGARDLYYRANRGDGGDPFPGAAANLAFSGSTTPNSNYYSGTSSGRSLTILSTTCGAAMDVRYAGPETIRARVLLPQLTKK